MAWLVRDATVLASVEVADTFAARWRGLLGRDGIEGALLLRPARSVHTLGMRFAIDVAHCDGDLRVLHITRMRPHRIGRPFRRAYVIIEAEAGAFERWGLHVGDELALHGEETAPPGGGSAACRRGVFGRRIRSLRKPASPLDPSVPVGVGPGGQDGVPLVGISGRVGTVCRQPPRPVARPPVPAAMMAETASARCAASEQPSGSTVSGPPSFPPRLRPLRRVRLPVACW